MRLRIIFGILAGAAVLLAQVPYPWFVYYDGTYRGASAKTFKTMLQLTVEFHDQETPAGLVDGMNRVFMLTAAPNPPDSLLLFQNGLLMTRCKDADQNAAGACDYELDGPTITFVVNGKPAPKSIQTASYRTR